MRRDHRQQCRNEDARLRRKEALQAEGVPERACEASRRERGLSPRIPQRQERQRAQEQGDGSPLGGDGLGQQEQRPRRRAGQQSRISAAQRRAPVEKVAFGAFFGVALDQFERLFETFAIGVGHVQRLLGGRREERVHQRGGQSVGRRAAGLFEAVAAAPVAADFQRAVYRQGDQLGAEAGKVVGPAREAPRQRGRHVPGRVKERDHGDLAAVLAAGAQRAPDEADGGQRRAGPHQPSGNGVAVGGDEIPEALAEGRLRRRDDAFRPRIDDGQSFAGLQRPCGDDGAGIVETRAVAQRAAVAPRVPADAAESIAR